MPADARTGMAARRMQNIIDAFRHFDTDRSGELSVEEVMGILTRKSVKAMSKEEAERFVRRFDKNKDGKLGIKEFAEAFDALEKDGGIEQTRMNKDQWRALRTFDEDGSGVLEREELLQILTYSHGKAKGMSKKDGERS